MASQTIEPGTKAPESRFSKKPAEVRVGHLRQQNWRIRRQGGELDGNFDIWFRWTDARVKPEENFRLVNGEVHEREKVEAYARGESDMNGIR